MENLPQVVGTDSSGKRNSFVPAFTGAESPQGFDRLRVEIHLRIRAPS